MLTDEQKAKTLEVLRNHERYPDLSALVIALCAVNGKSLNYITYAMDYKKHGIFSPTGVKGNRRTYEKARRLWEINPFDLPKEVEEGTLAETAIFSKTKNKIYWTEQNLLKRRLKVASDTRLLREKGEALPHLSDVLKQIFPEELYDYKSIKCNIPKDRIKGFFTEHDIPHSHELKALLQLARIPEAFHDFAALPSGRQKRQTPFTNLLCSIMDSISINQMQLALTTKAIDPDKKGITPTSISRLLFGKNSPVQYTVYLLSKGLATKLTGLVPRNVEELPEQVHALITGAGFDPQEMYRSSHEILECVDEKTAEFFPLLVKMRNAPDINVAAAVIGKKLGAVHNYPHWESGKCFPQKEEVLDIAERILPVFAEIRHKDYTPEQYIKLQKIASNSLLKQHTQRENSTVLAVHHASITRQKLHGTLDGQEPSASRG